MIDYLPPKEKEYTSIINSLYSKVGKSITLQVTEDCCLACTYCYQHHKTHNKMSWEIAKIFIDKLLNNQFEFCTTLNAQTIIIEFIGGEPLMEIELIDKIVSYLINQMIKLHHPWLKLFRFNICSNGILYFTEKVQNFFNKFYRWCSFTISVDGNKELHDSCRIDLQGNGSYDRAIAAMKDYKKKYNIQLPTKMTIAPENIQFLYDAVINLIQEGYVHIHLNCVYEKVWNQYYADILYNNMLKIGDYLLSNDLFNKIEISLFDKTIGFPLTNNDNENYCGGIADQMIAINYKGEIFSCIRYMESSLNNKQIPLPIGDIFNGYLSNNIYKNNYKKLSNISRRSCSNDICYYSPIASGCGWCSGYNYEEFGTPNQRTTYICLMHKARVNANKKYFEKLYQKINT